MYLRKCKYSGKKLVCFSLSKHKYVFKSLKIKDIKLIKVHNFPKTSFFKFIYRFNIFLWYLSLFDFWKKNNINKKYSYKFSALNDKWKIIFRWLIALKAQRFFTRIDNLLFSKCGVVLSYLLKNQCKLVIVPGSAMDTSSFLAIRTAKKLNIPSVMAVMHWDFFSKKGILRAKPDYLLVWGRAMEKSAVAQGISRKRILKVGFPCFDLSRNSLSKFNINQTITMLFAGAGVTFDEVGAIKIITSILAGMNIRTRLTYRPHPRGSTTMKFKEIEKKTTMVEIKCAIPNARENEFMATKKLLRKCNAVITPASTMILEAGSHGVPSLCLAYDDGVNDKVFPFSYAMESEHIKSVQRNPYIIFCRQKTDLNEKVNELINLIRKAPDPWEIRRSFSDVLENAGTVPSRILVNRALKKIIATTKNTGKDSFNELSCNHN